MNITRLVLASVLALSAVPVLAQTAPAFEKKNFNYSEWAKGRFSEAVTVTGPAKMIFLAGVGALLKRIGLDGSALKCGAHWPIHQPSAQALMR